MSHYINPQKNRQEFQKDLETLAYYVLEYGINKHQPVPNDKIDLICFVNLVYEGWKIAQNLSVRLIYDLQNEIEENDTAIKEFNKKRQKNISQRYKNINDILFFRRTQIQHAVNAIVWILYDNQHHILRRLSIDQNKSVNNLNRQNLYQVFTYIDEVNQSPYKCAIACDLTTFVHVGDVIIADLSKQNLPFLIELKSGKTNEKCRQILDLLYEQGYTLDNSRLQQYCQSQFLSKKEEQQLSRMLRQDERMNSLSQIVKEGRGIDLKYKTNIIIPNSHYQIESFDEDILELSEQLLEGKSYAIKTIDHCLHIGLYSNHLMTVAFDVWVQNYQGIKMNYKNIFNCGVVRPTLSLGLPSEVTTNLYTLKWELLFFLDIPLWIDTINSFYSPDEMILLSKRKSNQLKAVSKIDYAMYDDQIIAIKRKNKLGYIGDGILVKIFFDFYSPIDSVRPLFTDTIFDDFQPEME